MEFLRKTVKVGNSSGVILPRKLLGSEVRVIVVKRPVNIKRDIKNLKLKEKIMKAKVILNKSLLYDLKNQ